MLISSRPATPGENHHWDRLVIDGWGTISFVMIENSYDNTERACMAVAPSCRHQQLCFLNSLVQHAILL